MRDLTIVFLALILLHPCVQVWSQEPETKDDKLAAERLELMQKRIMAAQMTSTEAKFPEKFTEKPVFRYNDPARGYVSAAVWKLGDVGRPKALITTELHKRFRNGPAIVYEYLSLTPDRFTLRNKDFSWSPNASSLKFEPVPDAPAPDSSAPRRLLQIKTIARRFGGSEVAGNEQCELRLLPQPIDRYTPGTAERADGALFLLTFGTNPEVALLIESDGKQWTYAAGRLTGAEKVALTIDGKSAWQGGPLTYGAMSPYTASDAPAEIPGFTADGNEIKN